jgi:uncharacterized membrane protein YeaQ/YmgE (transglycosylase-associated protein family)
MYINILFWTIISVFVGVVGYKIEMNKGKHLWSNIVAAFFGVFVSAFVVHFLFWPDNTSFINPVAAVVGMGFGFWAVKLEDYIWLRV